MSEVAHLTHAPTKQWLDSYVWLPITMKQFETMANDMIVHLNRQADNTEQGFGSDYIAQVLTSAIHALERHDAHIRRGGLYDRCVNIISKHVSYHITEELQKKLKAQAGTESVAMTDLESKGEPAALPDEVRGQVPDAPPTAL